MNNGEEKMTFRLREKRANLEIDNALTNVETHPPIKGARAANGEKREYRTTENLSVLEKLLFIMIIIIIICII
jgi:hypothetical protein